MRPQRSLFETAPGREIHPRNSVFATVILIRDGQGGLGARIATLLTGLAQGFVEISGEGLAFASGLIGLKGPRRRRFERIGPPDMDDEADRHESGQ
jgi:hypothetical protein